MTDLPLNILTDAGFSADEAHAIAQHLVNGVDVHDDDRSTNQLDLESLPDGKKEAVERFTVAVAGDA